MLGLGTWPCASRPRLSCNEASEEHQLGSDETNKTVRAQQRQHAMHSPRKVEPIVSSHKKGSAPEKTRKLLSDLTRKGPFLKNKLCHLTRKGPLLKTDKDPNQNRRNRSQNASGSLEPCHNMWHGFATRDSYRREFCTTPSVVQQCSKRIFKHFSYCPGDSTSSVQWVMIQDKPGRVLRSSVLDHSWTPFNQRPSDSRNCCRTREEPLKPCQEIVFSSTLFFSLETN